MRLSVLDRSHLKRGRSAAEALRETVRVARAVEAAGYHRFWVGEHHGVPGVAGAAPTVLAAAVAARTTRIRVGTGGVMLPNHRPLVVAEQFAALAALFPGRIDAGVGRSVGFTAPVRRALGAGRAEAERFGEQLTELRNGLAGHGPDEVPVVAAEGLDIPLFVLATGAGADTAAQLGLPLVIAAPRGDDRMADAVARYRERFVRTTPDSGPHVVLSRSVAVADTAAQARELLASEAWAEVRSRRTGVFPPLVPPDEVRPDQMSQRERTLFENSLRTTILGTEQQVRDQLAERFARTGADELLVTTSAFDTELLLDSHRRLVTLADRL
nr:MsnO8 family LLM class oxidoreductase [Saccharopolyspora sp. HNM0983]